MDRENKIKLVVFDLWNTLVYKTGGFSGTAKMLEETGLSIPYDEFVKIFERSIQTKRWKSRYRAYENFCRNIGLDATEENVRLLIDIRDKADGKASLFKHAIPMIRQLKETGHKVGLLSNSCVFVANRIKNETNLFEYLDYSLFPFQVGAVKPDAKMFEEMLKISGCAPEEAVMVGDNMEEDILPARKLGMNAILFQDYEQLKKDFASLGINLSA